MTEISLNSLASVFGHVKNARLSAMGNSAEPQDGHVGWALNQKYSTIMSTIKSDLDTIHERVKKNLVDIDLRKEVFGHMKNAKLTVEANNPSAAEAMSGHRGWAEHKTLPVLKPEIFGSIETIRKIIS